MNLTIKYFGQLAECTGKNHEVLQEEFESVKALKTVLNTKYPALKEHEFVIAVDQKIADDQEILTTEAEVALLPPFSGG